MLMDPLRVYVVWATSRAGAEDPGRRLAAPCAANSAHAEALVKAGGMPSTTVVCERPPELADLAHQCASGPKTIVYPDPPIGLHEQKLP
jgi:hypothetical protein